MNAASSPQGGNATALVEPRAPGSPASTLPGAGTAASADGNAIAVYWGQNETGTEPELQSVCLDAQYDIVILSFVYAFGGSNSQDPNGYPSLNFGGHCTTPFDASHPNYLQCPQMASAIVACQNAGKKVLLSMGGAQGTYGFANDADAQGTANLMWNIVLGGADPLRPFGTAVLDGIDLDIEHGTQAGYAAFVQALRALMRADTRKAYYITGAPQCPFPDAFLGPGTGTALSEAAAFDFLFVQFYNNVSCQTSSPQGWPTALGAWAGLHASGGPKIFMGLPAGPTAVSQGYLDPNDFDPVVAGLKADAAVGGVMLWDVAYDATSKGPYSAQIRAALLEAP